MCTLEAGHFTQLECKLQLDETVGAEGETGGSVGSKRGSITVGAAQGPARLHRCNL